MTIGLHMAQSKTGSTTGKQSINLDTPRSLPAQKVPWYYHGIPWCTLVYYGSTMVYTDFTIVPQYVP